MKNFAANVLICFVATGTIGFSLVSCAPNSMRLTNGEIGTSKDAQPSMTADLNWLPKEESELRNLKIASPSATVNFLSATQKRNVGKNSSLQSSAPKRQAKLPVNEEMPAASDNSNSERISPDSSPGNWDTTKKKSLSSELEQMVKNDSVSTKIESAAESSNATTNTSSTNNVDISEYTPHEVAQYILWTGNEKGVALAIYQFIREDLLNRDYAIQFLEAVKEELNTMRNLNPSLAHQVNTDESPSISTPTTTTSLSETNSQKTASNASPFLKSNEDAKASSESLDSTRKKRVLSNGDTNVMQHERVNYSFNPISVGGGNDESFPIVTNGESSELMETGRVVSSPNETGGGTGIHSHSQSISEKPQERRVVPPRKSYSIDDLDYDELVEKLQVAESKIREYSLEEVIYHLAKELFSQGLHETEQTQEQHSIQKFAQVIENGAAMGYIPKDLEKTILDTLVRALVDAVMEHEHGLLTSRTTARAKQNNSNTKPSKYKTKIR